MAFGNVARGVANYKAGKFGLRTLFRHPMLAIAFGVGALWYRKRLQGQRGNLGGGSFRRGGGFSEYPVR
jgi:hypothetical protein